MILKASTTIALDLGGGLRKRDYFLIRAQTRSLRAFLRLADGYGSLRAIRLLIAKGIMAGRQGFEPRYADPESAVLPLDDLPGSRITLPQLAF